MSKHTPGPWYVSKRNPLRVIESGPRGNIIARMGNNLGVCAQEQAEANARLIASAPDLLEALQHTLRAMIQVELSDSSRQEWAAAQAAARAAIAKATGEAK